MGSIVDLRTRRRIPGTPFFTQKELDDIATECCAVTLDRVTPRLMALAILDADAIDADDSALTDLLLMNGFTPAEIEKGLGAAKALFAGVRRAP